MVGTAVGVSVGSGDVSASGERMGSGLASCARASAGVSASIARTSAVVSMWLRRRRLNGLRVGIVMSDLLPGFHGVRQRHARVAAARGVPFEKAGDGTDL